MPCSDVTEILKLQIDAEDRVVGYSLTKRTCGGALGKEALLLKWCGGLPASQVMGTTVDQFLDKYSSDDPAVEFVRLKHLLALKKGVAALTGEIAARPDDSIAVESIDYGPEGVEMVAHIKVDVMTDEIKACGRCAGCGTNR
ncbi:MAG: hypothetical protein HY851_01370 [candidate division Zixibacteria bacterium]|nr:hypothetical protein [candidate division Zixibacteria bacterium]